MTKLWRVAMTVLLSAATTACALMPGEPPGRPSAIAKPKRPSPRLDCSFADGDGALYRTYVMTTGALTDEGPPRIRFKITSDDGETITAMHTPRGAASPSVLKINLRQHDAVLTQAGADGSGERTLRGTCAEDG